MFFDTPVYILFLALVVLAYWRMPRKPQNILLLVASYFFYAWWDWRFLSLIIVSTCVDYYFARIIDRSEVPKIRTLLLVISLVTNLGFLGVFKYFNFFVDSFAHLLSLLGVEHVNRTVLWILLPPGISFYTFQEVAYIVDVYQRRMKPATSLIDYALFISLFPHLIAGPIQRPSHLLPQVQQQRTLNSNAFFAGIMLILFGLFRKCVVADNCALLADGAFSGRMGEPSLAVVAIGTYAFAWQIYGDFSGYSDIARGSAQLMGFHFMVNFRQPYLATSLQDFWRRWHISLSTWLRDYLYIPLGGNRNGERRTYRNLLLTMLLGGLWHGANWTYIIWGALHGAGLAIGRCVRTLLRLPEATDVTGGPAEIRALPTWGKRVVVFHLVCLAWIFFRAESYERAVGMLSGLPVLEWRSEFLTAFKYLAFFALPLFAVDLISEHRDEEYPLERESQWKQVSLGMGLLVVLTLFSGNEINAFLYFQF
jgi:alginate O-acetyltransferase complex protein AlgI